MKKLNFTVMALLLAVTTQVTANDEKRHRLGVGYSSTDAEVEGFSFGYGNGIKLEYGYDINKYVGIHVSYEQNDESILRGDTLKLGGDIGYTFYHEDFSLKPFISGGAYMYDENFYHDTGAYWGFGARVTYKNFYADVRQDYFDMEDENSGVDIEQFSFTIGLKL